MIRVATPSDIRAIAEVQVDSWRSTYRGIIPDDYLDGLSYEHRERVWRVFFGSRQDGKEMFVAVDENGAVIGFACGGPQNGTTPGFQGELYAIYLRDEAKGRGHGRALLDAVARFLIANGVRSMLIWVLADNPSRKFYEACGGHEAAHKKVVIGGAELEEVGYGWELANS
jgi:L-amino acid N-acyltransferase YncA